MKTRSLSFAYLPLYLRVVVSAFTGLNEQCRKLFSRKKNDGAAGTERQYHLREESKDFADHSFLLENFGAVILSEIRVAILDSQFRFVWLNKKFCDHFNYTPVDLLHRKLDELYCLNQDEHFFRQVFQTLSQGKRWSGEIQVKAEEASPLWIKTTIVPIGKDRGQPTSFVVFNSNITPTKKALEEKNIVLEKLTLSEARYRALVENQSDLVSLYRFDGSLIYANTSFCQFYGNSLKQLNGANLASFLDGVPNDFVRRIYLLTPEEQEISGVFLLQDCIGNKKWLSLSAKGLFSQAGELFEFLLAGRDVTDLKNAEIQRSVYAQDLERIAFMTSHNVRGPIASMLGLVELMRMNAIESNQWAKVMDDFKKCVDKLDSYSRELSSFVCNRQSEE